MFIEIVCVLFLSYMMYRQGIRQLFKSRLFSSLKADHVAYMFFMLAGLSLGTLSTLSIIYNWRPETSINAQIILAGLTSILLGEWMYRRNKNLIYKLISPQQQSNENHKN